MNKLDAAMMVIENHRIRSPHKLRAAAEALASYDIMTYGDDIRRLLNRAQLASDRETSRGDNTPGNCR
jgi:hypothetical protein